jgi:hypothetical protein
METQATTDQSQPVQLTPDQQSKIVAAIKEARRKGKDARKPYDEDGDDCHNAYLCKNEESEKVEMEWRSNAYLPWCRDAVDATFAYFVQNMFPRNNDLISLKGRTQEDHPGVRVMEQYLKYLFQQNEFADQFKLAIKQALTRNHTALKGFWRDEKKVVYEWEEQQDPMTGQVVKRKVPKDITVYNNVWFDLIPIKDIHFYPIKGDFHKTLRVHDTFKFKEELLEQAQSGQTPYFNLDLVEQEKDHGSGDSFYKAPTDSSLTESKEEGDCGLKISEAYIHRIKVGAQVFRNYLATVVNDKVLIRFQPNPYGMGKCPIIFQALNPLDDNLCGDGLLSPGLSLQYAGNAIFNMKLDELKAKLYGSYKYYDDEVFDPDNFLAVPGGLVEMADAESVATNLIPVNPHLEHLQIAYAEVAEIKAEFEAVTVPPVVKGLLAAQEATATETNYAQSNASGKMHVMAHQMDKLLRWATELAYDQIFQRLQYDPRVKEDIARVTQEATVTITHDEEGNPLPEPFIRQRAMDELVAMLPQFIPVSDIDIQVIGYQNQVRRQEEMMALERALPQLAQSPAAKYQKWYDTADAVYELIGLDSKRFLMSKEDAEAADAQEQEQLQAQADAVQQQAIAQVELEKEKLELEKLKSQHQAVVDEKKLEIEILKLQIERERMAAESDRFDKETKLKQSENKEKAKNDKK